MELAIVNSRAMAGIRSPHISVEVHLSPGLPRFSIVGLAETVVRESEHRVRSAILNNHLDYPVGRITINLAPAELPKEGGRFDLPIAIGMLAASGQVPLASLKHHEFIGELALTGALRPVRGCLPAAHAVQESGRRLVLPRGNIEEATLIRGLSLYATDDLVEACAHLCGTAPLPEIVGRGRSPGGEGAVRPDLNEIRAQHQAKRALEIAASGGHNLLLSGPPGSGKTMLAERLPGILPEMTETEALESAAVEEGADAVAFGRPAGPESAFSLTDLERLTAQIEQDTGIQTYIV